MEHENSDQTPELDLFGNPVEPLKDPRGRPAYAKNKENQQVVIDLIGQGFKQFEVAAYLQCDEKTLRKHFSRELEQGRVMLRGEAALVRARKMRLGNMAATKAILDGGEVLPPTPKRPGKDEPKGKKEQLDAEAKAMPSGWGDLLNGKPN